MTEGTPSRPRLDAIDLRILEELQTDSTLTYRELSTRVALSASACIARVKQFERQGIIQGYHASVAVEQVRPTLLFMVELVMRKHAIAELDRFDRFLAARPEVIEMMRVQGQVDYIIKVLLADMREWRAFANRVLKPEYGVERMVSHLITDQPKLFTGYPLR
jgi:Lrp/AsnC family leucine-responsive transcriptional regulator